MEIKAKTSQKERTISYRTNHTPVKVIQTKASRREVRSGRTPVNVHINGDPLLEQRVADLESATDGLIEGVDFLTLYRIKRDN